MQIRKQKAEEKLRMQEYMKEWSRPRDDLECDDLKVIVNFCDVILFIKFIFGNASLSKIWLNSGNYNSKPCFRR